MEEQSNQEEAFVRAFIVRERRERWLGHLASAKHRRKITDSLAHPNMAWFDPRYVKPVPNSPSILKTLRSKGAGQTCWVISEFSKFDSQELDLAEILVEIVGSQMGTILSCVPGRLAYLEAENERYILERS